MRRLVALPISCLALLASSVIWPTAASAYCIPPYGDITKWYSEGTTRTLHFSPEYPSTWWSILDNSVMQWDNSNVAGSAFNYGGAVAASDWSTYNYASFRFSFADQHWPDWPAKSDNSDQTPTHTWVHLDYNSYRDGWYLNSDGTMSQTGKNVDLRTITVHEVGHASGLSHPEVCGRVSQSEIASVMYINWTPKRFLAQDDKDAMAVMY